VSHRESFVRWFGENQAVAVEAAAEGHLIPPPLPPGMEPIPHAHADDNRGSDEFAYQFLVCVGYECFDDRFRAHHGITVKKETARDWCIDQDLVRTFDGDCPDYIALMVGTYNEWMLDPSWVDSARWRPEKEEQQ